MYEVIDDDGFLWCRACYEIAVKVFEEKTFLGHHVKIVKV